MIFPTRAQQLALVAPDDDLAIEFYVRRPGFRLLTDEDQGGGKLWVTVAPPGSGDGCALPLARATTPAQSPRDAIR